MNLKSIREEAWDVAREISTVDSARLWTKREMNRYINRVYRFIARETKCIRDALTPAVCQIAVAPPADLAALTTLAASNAWYAYDLAEYNDVNSWMYHTLVAPRGFVLHDSVLDIDEVKWRTAPWRLTHVSVSKWQSNPKWEQVIGYPTEYATDYQANSIALNYRTQTTDTLMLTVRRMPLVDLIEDTDIPEIRVQYHDFMLNGILEQMYAKQDIETLDTEKVLKYKEKFKADVDEIKQQEVILDQRLRPNNSLSAFR